MHAYAFMNAQATPPVSGGQYGQTYVGEGTYYGGTTGGNCGFRSTVLGMYSGMIPGEQGEEGFGTKHKCVVSECGV